MTPRRFAQIVDAYGADPSRWPTGERAAACAFAQAYPDEARTRLEEAAALDACLSADIVEPASRSLQRRIVASAKPPGHRPARGARAARWWLPGAAIAGAGVAGLVAGALAMSFLIVGAGEGPGAVHEPSYMSTAFGFDTSSAEGSIE
ncbi:hypothetical protein DWV00_25440 [Trinickia dinghuensis]|uniref:Anti-sigma factor n=2 Tax=Trinickia dinghuensis TaxID=2291023 RepID=A0A3D8JSX3_9BURK|nr:hypothetical protein [Trinickia dinghuensis]RDU96138.1 hypothetical protein DWV00_25440 [Trinickia dinghuensis]